MINLACAPVENAVFSDDTPLTLARYYAGGIGPRTLPVAYKPKAKEVAATLKPRSPIPVRENIVQTN